MLENEIRVTPNQAGNLGHPTSLRSIVEAIFRQRWKMLLVTGSVLGVVLLYSFGAPKRFTSEMVLLVQNARLNETVTASQGGYAPALNDVSEEQLNSEVAVLKSDDIIDEVVDPGWIQRSVNSTPRAVLLAHEKAVNKMRANLTVTTVRSSHAIAITMVANSPEKARDTLNQLLQAFLRKQRDLGRLPGSSKVFSEQAAQYAQNLDAARRDLANYQNQHGFVTLGGQENSLETKLRDLQGVARDTDVQISELEHRVGADEKQLAATPQRVSTVDRSAPPTGTLDQLNVLLVTLKNKRTELMTKFTANDPLVKDIDEQIANTMAALNQATTSRPHEVTSDIDPLWQASRHDLSINQITLAGMRARRTSLAAQISSLQSDLNKAELQEGDFDTLQQRVADLEGAYKAYVQKRDNSLVSDLMDEQKWLNVAIVQYPTLAMKPSRPQPATDVPLGALTAFLLGGCAVFIFEAIRQQVSTPAELEAITRYPVLATIPYDQLVGGMKELSQGTVEPPGRLSEEVGGLRLDHALSSNSAGEPKTWLF
jgi:uncharacterized protein involved in exopolysaccharide biosynthesis